MTECTVADNGGLVTFDPLAGRVLATGGIRHGPIAPLKLGIQALTCPSTRLCVGFELRGDRFTVDPLAPARSRVTRSIGSGPAGVAGLDCPTTRFCVAATDDGQILSGAPGARRWVVTQLRGSALDGIDCPSPSECVAVDGAGDVYVGRARR